MIKYVYLLLTFLWFSLLSCNESTTTFKKQYYDIKGLVNKQILENKSNNPTFKKTLTVNGKKETVNLRDINWEKELEVFLLADLNKKDYLNKFQKDSTKNRISYFLKPKESAHISFLNIVFSEGKPKIITAKLLTDNFLYKSERTLELILDGDKLQSYSVTGWQKLLVGETKKYHLKAVKE